MNKKITTFLLFIFIIIGVFIKFNNDVILGFFLTKLSKWTEWTVTAESVDIDYFKGKINFNDLKILNKPNFYDKNIFDAKKLSIEIEFSSIFSDLVKINKFILYQPRFFFEIRDLTEKKETIKDNIGVIEKIIKQTPPKIYAPKKNDKNFIVLNLSLKNSKAFVRHQSSSEALTINLSNMSFQNVGNGNSKKYKNFQHYKDIMKIIMRDIYFRIPDMKLRKFLKEKYKIK
jgi:hypothetical protein